MGVIGLGYWGPNLVRNFAELEGCEVRGVCDADERRLDAIRKRYPALRTHALATDLIADPDIDAVVIATPLRTHHPLALAALEAGKHVLIEKPMTHSVETAVDLNHRAKQNGLVLQVDHTYLYTGAVRKLHEIVSSGELGQLLYVDSVRVNLGLFQRDTNVIWDLAPHDVSIALHLLDLQPDAVSATGMTHYGKHESMAYITLFFPDSIIAHVHVNWLAPVKVRSTLIGGSRRMVVYDDLEPSEKLRIYDKGVSLSDDAESRANALVDYRVGDMFAPHIDKTEALGRLCQSFVTAIETGKPSLSTAQDGLSVVKVLEAAHQSVRKGGERIALQTSE